MADLLYPLLRPGDQGDAAYSVAVLKRIVRQILQVLGLQGCDRDPGGLRFFTPEL
jgi:hypothetical protein